MSPTALLLCCFLSSSSIWAMFCTHSYLLPGVCISCLTRMFAQLVADHRYNSALEDSMIDADISKKRATSTWTTLVRGCVSGALHSLRGGQQPDRPGKSCSCVCSRLMRLLGVTLCPRPRAPRVHVPLPPVRHWNCFCVWNGVGVRQGGAFPFCATRACIVRTSLDFVLGPRCIFQTEHYIL